MNKELKQDIKKWLKDYSKTQPMNVQIDDDSFEGSAYYLFQAVLNEMD